jgi:predicted ester cyclase
MRRPALLLVALALVALTAVRLAPASPSLAAPPPIPPLSSSPTSTSSGNASNATASNSTADLAANKALVKKMVDAVFNAHDISAVDKYYAPSFVDHQTTTGQTADLAAFKTDTQSSFTAFPDLTYTIKDIVAEGDEVWAREQICGTQTGPLSTLAPTGKHVCIDAIDIVRIQNNLIVEHWGVADDLSLLEQLGVVPTGS